MYIGGITVNAPARPPRHANSAITGPLTIVRGSEIPVSAITCQWKTFLPPSLANDGMFVITR